MAIPRASDLQAPQILQLLDQVAALRGAGQLQAALLMAWSALEASMRRAAEANAIELRRQDTLEVLRELVSNGVLGRERYRDITEALRVRSAIAHGFDTPETVALAPILDLIEMSTRDLLADTARQVVPPA
jgi:DNA-binding transcriptional ArsR family regulator